MKAEIFSLIHRGYNRKKIMEMTGYSYQVVCRYYKNFEIGEKKATELINKPTG